MRSNSCSLDNFKENLDLFCKVLLAKSRWPTKTAGSDHSYDMFGNNEHSLNIFT